MIRRLCDPDRSLQLAGCMSESALVPAELEAIRDAFQRVDSGNARTGALPSRELVALVFRRLPELSKEVLPGRCELHLSDLRTYRAGGTMAHSVVAARGEVPALALRFSNELVTRVAAVRCGDDGSDDGGDELRSDAPASATALRLFEPFAHAFFEQVLAVWRAAGLEPLTATTPADGDWLAELPLRWTGDPRGAATLCLSRLAIGMLLAQERQTRDELVRVFSSIEVPVAVELGRVGPLCDLRVGTRWMLAGRTQDRVQISINGVSKAWAIPVVHHHVLGVLVKEVAEPSSTSAAPDPSYRQEPSVNTARSMPIASIEEPCSADGVCSTLTDEPTATHGVPRPTTPSEGADAIFDRLGEVPLELSVELGRVMMPLGELQHVLAPGCVISLGKSPRAQLEVRVASRLVARGEAITIGDRYGVLITELVKEHG